MNLVQQEHGERTCGQCCVAMVAGKSREQVIVDMRKTGGTRASDLRSILRSYGYLLGRYWLGFRPVDQVAVCRMKGKSDLSDKEFSHWVVWDGTKILCPDWGQLSKPPWEGSARITSMYLVSDLPKDKHG